MIVAVDTGGTKTLIASFNTEGKPIKSVRFPTPKNQQDYAKELLTTLQDSFSDTPIDALVVAVPGVIRNGVVKWCGNLPWENFKLLVFLQKHFTCPISIQNDADLAGLAEANSIKPVPELCLYLTISTGIGSGVVINGRLTPELSGSEAGHMMIECDGRIRSWESFASGKAIYTTYQKYAYQISNKHIWNKIAHNINRGLICLVPALEPDVIVIGGSIGTHFDRYADTLTELLDTTLPPQIKRPRLVQAKHPEEAVIYGCYYYALHTLTS